MLHTINIDLRGCGHHVLSTIILNNRTGMIYRAPALNTPRDRHVHPLPISFVYVAPSNVDPTGRARYIMPNTYQAKELEG